MKPLWHQFKHDWFTLFLPAGFVFTLISTLPLMGPFGMLLAIPGMFLGYLFSLVLAEMSAGKPLKEAWREKSFRAMACLLGAFFVAGAGGSQAGDITTLDPLTYMLLVSPVLAVLGLGVADFADKKTVIYPLYGYGLGCALAWICYILVHTLTASWPDTLRILTETMVFMPLLCLPAWMGVQIRERV